MIKPQLAIAAKDFSFMLLGKECCEVKIDGYRVIIEKTGDKVKIYNRNLEDVSAKLPHLIDQFKALPGDVTLDGEVCYVTGFVKVEKLNVPLVDFSRTATVMQSNPFKAVAEQKNGKLTFIAFDMLASQGIPMIGFSDFIRRQSLEAVIEYFEVVKESKTITITPRWTDVAPVEKLIGLGCEGVMIKDLAASYKPGSRNRAWKKVKANATADVVIMGFKEGNSKYKGQIGSIEFGQYKNGILTKRGFCSGMDDVDRKKISENRNAFLGKVIEVRFFGQSGKDKNGLRHPQIVTHGRDIVRTDKKPEDCTWETV